MSTPETIRYNLSLLDHGIIQAQAEFPQGRTVFPEVTDIGRYFSDSVVVLNRDANPQTVWANPGYAVLNAVIALGITPRLNPEGLYVRLHAAHEAGQRRQPQNPPLLEKEAVHFGTTMAGLEHLVNIIKGDQRLLNMNIKTKETSDAGVVHNALLHRYKAVYFDRSSNLAVTLVGASQNNGKVLWLAIHADMPLIGIARMADASIIFGPSSDKLKFVRIDPRNLLQDMNFPVYLIGREENPWEIPSDTPAELDDATIIFSE